MKNTFKKILSKPKIVITVAVVIALAIGIFSYINHKKTLSENFAKIDAFSKYTQTDDVSKQDLTLSFPVGGRVQNVSVKIGDSVTAGQVLATLDQSNVSASLQSAQGSLAQARANYNKILAAATPQDVAVSQAAVEVASTALQNAKQNMLNEFKTAQSNANTIIISSTNPLFDNPLATTPKFVIAGTVQINQQLSNDINNERIEINSFQSTWSDEVSNVSEDKIDQVATDSLTHLSFASKYLADIISILTNYTQVDNSTSKATLNAIQLSVTNAKTAIDALSTTITNYNQAIKSAQSSLDSAKAGLNMKQSPARNEDVAIANAQVLYAQGQVNLASANFNNTILRAPVSGVITQVDVKIGEQAQALKEVVVLQH